MLRVLPDTMNRSCLLLTLLTLASAGVLAQSQVYRCGDSSVYTDKPCDGATPVDLRGNIIDAGPRGFPPAPQDGARALILPDPAERAQKDAAPSVWGRRDAAETEHRSRTGPFGTPR